MVYVDGNITLQSQILDEIFADWSLQSQFEVLGTIQVLTDHPAFNRNLVSIHQDRKVGSDCSRNMSDLAASCVYHLGTHASKK